MNKSPAISLCGKPFRVLLLLTWHHDDILAGTLRFAREHGWHANLLPTFTQELPRDWRGDGMLLMLPADRRERELHLDLVTRLKLPCVLLSPFPYCAHFPNVQLDHAAIGRLAADHLVERGFRHIYFFSAMRRWDHRLRLDAFVERLRQRGREAVVFMGKHEHEQHAQEEILRFVHQLAGQPRPMAIWAINDIIAGSLLEALADAGIASPEEAIVLGCENIALVAETCQPSLSSIDSNMDTLAYQGAAMLHALMQGKQPPQLSITVPPRGVVARASTDRWWAAHAGVRRVIDLIRERYAADLHGPDFCRAAGMSRLGLHAAFQRETGRTAKAILEGYRLRAAEALLRGTKDKIGYIAAVCGFQNLTNLRRAFRRVHHLPPEAWRKTEQQKNLNPG